MRFDNRGIGLLEWLDGARTPHALLMAAAALGLLPRSPCRLDDMARDRPGLMDVLGLAGAPVVGASMGGMIVQMAAAHFPDRVRSLASVLSTSSHPRLPGPSRAVVRRLGLARPRGDDRTAVIGDGVRLLEPIATRAPMRQPGDVRMLITRADDRGYHPQGVRRQLAARVASGSRVELLGQLPAPMLVIHGSADPLAPLGAGIGTERRITCTRLAIIEGIGHDLPASKRPRLAELITVHVTAVDRMRKAAV